MHVLQRLGVRLSTGVEICPTRYIVSNIDEYRISQHLILRYEYSHLKMLIPSQLSLSNFQALSSAKNLESRNVNFLNRNILDSDTFDPHTVIHMCDCAFAPEDHNRLSKIFNNRYLEICYGRVVINICKNFASFTSFYRQ